MAAELDNHDTRELIDRSMERITLSQFSVQEGRKAFENSKTRIERSVECLTAYQKWAQRLSGWMTLPDRDADPGIKPPRTR